MRLALLKFQSINIEQAQNSASMAGKATMNMSNILTAQKQSEIMQALATIDSYKL